MRKVLNNSCRENQNTHFIFSDFFSEIRAVYEIMSKNMVEPDRPQTIRSFRMAYWISKQAHASARAPKPTHLHTHRHTHTRTHANIRMPSPMRARARTHTQKYVIRISLAQQKRFPDSA